MEVRRSREQWCGLLEALVASGQPLAVFACHAGVNAKSLGGATVAAAKWLAIK